MGIISFDHYITDRVVRSAPTQKASLGMYSGCDYPYKLILFVYFLTLPSSFNYIVFYACFCSFFRIIHASTPSDIVFPLTHVHRVGYFQTEAAAVQLTDASQITVFLFMFMHVCMYVYVILHHLP